MNWHTPRSGLAQHCDRLYRTPCRIAYLGDSVVAQRDGFRPRLHEWLCRHFGQEHLASNACLGSNGSLCSVFVMDELVIKQQPALCFVVCSVADLAPYTPAQEVGPVLEGIVRKLADINCPVVFIHMYRDDRELDASSAVIADYEAVAEYYGVPSINVGAHLSELFSKGEYTPAQLFKDGIHTNQCGAEVSAQIIIDCLKEQLSRSLLSPELHQLFGANFGSKQYLHSRNFHHTSLVYCRPEMLDAPGLAREGHFRFFYPVLEVPVQHTISYNVAHGEIVGILAVVDKASGIVAVSTSAFSDSYQLWDDWCQTERIKAIIFDRYPTAPTELRLALLETSVEYRDVSWMSDSADLKKSLRIIGFLQRSDR